ncbi:hypothetical protein B0H17DRAFT_1133180 [Mycena rosella]|uniref:Uncharacterized protein n=1 Tax=Mycena rosella TaxID=1033263 RepID=A0AAD7GKR5_MYCRO|nr:hypothetical protein B0H17DRAFT_1133180 [Mycena rosella]
MPQDYLKTLQAFFASKLAYSGPTVHSTSRLPLHDVLTSWLTQGHQVVNSYFKAFKFKFCFYGVHSRLEHPPGPCRHDLDKCLDDLKLILSFSISWIWALRQPWQICCRSAGRCAAAGFCSAGHGGREVDW